MNALSVDGVVEVFEVWNVQHAHRVDGDRQRFVGAALSRDRLSHRAQGAEDLRPIEPLPFTMVAEAHRIPPNLGMPAI